MADRSEYQRGYAAGQRAGKASRENAMWRQVFCAALTGTLQSGNWYSGDKKWSTPSAYVQGSADFADAALRSHGDRA